MNYAKVIDGKIIYRDGQDDLKIQKLIAHGYTEIVETESPEYDTITQYISANYELVNDRVTKVWTIYNRDPKDIEQIKLAAIEENTITEIRKILNSIDRDLIVKDLLDLYDTNIVEVRDAK